MKGDSEDKLRFASHFKCPETECVLLRKNGSPLMVELPYVDLALGNGAERYPEICLNGECWIELSYKDLERLEDEMDWVFGW
jgi:hypothetical protein